MWVSTGAGMAISMEALEMVIEYLPSSKLGDRLCGREGCGKSDAEGLTRQFCLGQSFRNQHFG